MARQLLESQVWDEILNWARSEMNWSDDFIKENMEMVVRTYWKSRGISD